MTVSLQVTTRESGTRTQLQAEEKLPAVVYGPKQESIPLAMGKKDFEKVFKEAGESSIIVLEGLAEPVEVLVQAVEFHPTKPEVLHVDFYAIERGKDITTEIPISFVGEAPIEKSGGMVNKVLHEVTVTCRPSKLPKEIEVDISGLAEEDSHISVADLIVAEGVTIDHEEDEIVASAQGAREEEPEPEETEEVDMEAIAVEEKGKGEEADDTGTDTE